MKASKFTDAQKAFNSKISSECLNVHWFTNLADAGGKLDWRRHYNDGQSHSAVGSNVPSTQHLLGDAPSPSS